MPNRYVREDAIESESVNALSWQAEVFWRRLLNRADDFGRYSGNLKLLRSQIFPLQSEKVSELDVARLVSECESVGLLFGYKDSDEKPYLVLNKWEQGRAKHSKYPDPPKEVCSRMKTFVYRCSQTQTFPPTPIPTPNPDSDAVLKKEKAREDQSDFSVEPPPGMPDTEERAVFIGERAGVPRERALAYWNELASRGWRDSYGPILDFGRHAKIRYDREKNKEAERGLATTSGARRVSSMDIKNVIQAKTTMANDIRNQYASECAAGTEWSSREKKQEYFKLKKEIKELNAKMANML